VPDQPTLPEPQHSLLHLAAKACNTKNIDDINVYWAKALEVANTIDFNQPVPTEVDEAWRGYGPDDTPPEVPHVASALLTSMRCMAKAGLDTRTQPGGASAKKTPVFQCLLRVSPWVKALVSA